MPDAGDSNEFALALSTSRLLYRAQQLASDRFARLVGEDGVTLRQFAVLAAIAESPGRSQAEVVRATGIDRSTLAEMILRMEKRGWIIRAPSASDARANALRLAPAGGTLLAAALAHAKAADAAILDALPRPKRKPFLTTLLRLSKIADEIEEQAERSARKAARKQERDAEKARERAAERAKKTRRKRRAEAADAAKTRKPAPESLG